jgi:Arc/MetJ-type ribon-helix-helix transcriptional regulator
MKAITVRLSEGQLKQLRKIKAKGFSSISEVIKCATMSLAKSAPGNRQQTSDR